MAAILYHIVDGEVKEERVNACDVANLLESGYSASPEFPTKEEADANKSGKLSAKEIRAAAKEAGLDSSLPVKELRAALGYED